MFRVCICSWTIHQAKRANVLHLPTIHEMSWWHGATLRAIISNTRGPGPSRVLRLKILFWLGLRPAGFFWVPSLAPSSWEMLVRSIWIQATECQPWGKRSSAIRLNTWSDHFLTPSSQSKSRQSSIISSKWLYKHGLIYGSTFGSLAMGRIPHWCSASVRELKVAYLWSDPL